MGIIFGGFFIEVKKKLTGDEMNELLIDNLEERHWIDGLQRRVKLRRKAIPELIQWCNQLESENINEVSQKREDTIQIRFESIQY